MLHMLGKSVWLFAFLSISTSLSPACSASIGSANPKAPIHIYYSDPVHGSMNGDGSSARPWGSLQDITNAGLINGHDNLTGKVHAGDLIYLKNGNHGTINLYSPGSSRCANTDFITIQAYPGHHPVINSLYMLYCSRWVFRGITFLNAPDFVRSTIDYKLIYFAHSDNIIISGNTLLSSPDYAKWTVTDWENKSASTAIFSAGVTDCTISLNNISGVGNGIVLDGDSILCYGNHIDYFANDGIDFLSSNTLISFNRITNHYGQWQTGFHSDGMQGWTPVYANLTENVTIDRNIVIASTGTYPAIPAIPTGVGDDLMQGISIFTGTWRNVTMTNNVVAASSYSGLTIFGVDGAIIENNTIIQQGKYTTWLGVFHGSSNVIVRNNISNLFNLPATGVVEDHNLVLIPEGWSTIPAADPKKLFVKYDPTHAAFDFHLAPGSPAIGTGSSLGAPLHDLLGLPRNPNKIDIGAYSYRGP